MPRQSGKVLLIVAAYLELPVDGSSQNWRSGTNDGTMNFEFFSLASYCHVTVLLGLQEPGIVSEMRLKSFSSQIPSLPFDGAQCVCCILHFRWILHFRCMLNICYALGGPLCTLLFCHSMYQTPKLDAGRGFWLSCGVLRTESFDSSGDE